MTTTDKGMVNVPQNDQAESIAASELSEVFARQRAAFDRNPAPSLQQRRATLLKLERLIEQNRLILAEA
ncbi:MAG TPA: coniferyl aldehyde dehydrogenase, partial [Mycobacterium sp.]|nr:coniferyl aldehyde dehydrogenase [Mycobacterium sp.]